MTTTQRPLPSMVAYWMEAAAALGLSEPLGRALYVKNRRLNGTLRRPDEILASAKHETAVRWRRHWESGGSLKTLRRSESEQRRFVIARRERHLGDGERLRKAVRRARRSAALRSIIGDEQEFLCA